MNSKEFTIELSRRIERSTKETGELTSYLLGKIAQHLQDDDIVAVQSFGTFEVKKKAERISVNPTTKKRMLIPPKLVLSFRPSSLLKDKFK